MKAIRKGRRKYSISINGSLLVPNLKKKGKEKKKAALNDRKQREERSRRGGKGRKKEKGEGGVRKEAESGYSS